jgi:osmotically-inducible protein OsmY
MHCRLYGQATMFDPTKSLRLKRIRLGAMTVFATCCALQVSAQDLASLTERPAGTVTSSAPTAPESATNEARRLRVETALHDDPYFNDAHVNVALKNGVVTLQGFVFTEWDLLHAIRIAKKAAGDARVVDDLSIELGGRR